MRVVWTRAALRGVWRAHDYIVDFNPQAAARLAEALFEAGESLAIFPHRGRPVRGTTMRESAALRGHYSGGSGQGSSFGFPHDSSHARTRACCTPQQGHEHLTGDDAMAGCDRVARYVAMIQPHQSGHGEQCDDVGSYENPNDPACCPASEVRVLQRDLVGHGQAGLVALAAEADDLRWRTK